MTNQEDRKKNLHMLGVTLRQNMNNIPNEYDNKIIEVNMDTKRTMSFAEYKDKMCNEESIERIINHPMATHDDHYGDIVDLLTRRITQLKSILLK